VAGQQPAFEVLILGAIGGLLVLLNGAVDLWIAATASAVSAPIQFTDDAAILGAVSILLAILLGVILLYYWVSVDSGALSLSGTFLAIVAAFSLWVGGGFLVGFVLSFTAGVLAVVLANLPTPSLEPAPPAIGPRSTIADQAISSPPSPVGPPPTVAPERPPPPGGTWQATQGNVVWFCPKCDFQNPLATRICGNCGTPRVGNS
jgi:hypothetical protein